MNSRLMKYLESRGAKEVDEELLSNYRTFMKETILKTNVIIKRNNTRCAIMRFRPNVKRALRS